LTIIRDRGTTSEDSVTETIFLGPNEQIIRFFISRGRREKENVAKITPDTDSKQSRKSGIYSQLGAGGGIAQFAQRNSAVGYTPVITNIPEGVYLSAMATVSGDRRYVRINAAPIFSSITDVFTFTPVK
jgi:hypothetical protein